MFVHLVKCFPKRSQPSGINDERGDRLPGKRPGSQPSPCWWGLGNGTTHPIVTEDQPSKHFSKHRRTTYTNESPLCHLWSWVRIFPTWKFLPFHSHCLVIHNYFQLNPNNFKSKLKHMLY